MIVACNSSQEQECWTGDPKEVKGKVQEALFHTATEEYGVKVTDWLIKAIEEYENGYLPQKLKIMNGEKAETWSVE